MLIFEFCPRMTRTETCNENKTADGKLLFIKRRQVNAK